MRTSTNWAKALGFCLVVGLVLTSQVLAQNPTGTLTGKVTDADGAALPGVTVTVTSPSLQGTRSTQSGVNGDYKFAFLPAGDYKATYELQGFATIVREIRISAAQSDISDIQMKLAEVTEEIVVTSNLETISESRTAQTTYAKEEVEKLAIDRDLESAALLVPGVTSTGPNQNVTISGAMSFENLFLVNGVVVNENIRGQALDLFIEDAIQETTTSTSAISAEYGRFTGGVVNVLTKSGGNQLSGSLRVNLENDDWLARTPVSPERIDKINKISEATLGGAFVKDRLWFFGAGRDRSTEASAQTTLTLIPYATTREQTRVEGKLTLGITPSHNVIGSYLNIDDLRTGTSFGQIITIESTTDREDPQEIISGNYTGILTSNFFVEAQYSERKLGIGHGAGGKRDLIAGTLMRNRGTSYRYHAPTFCGECEQEQRDNENLLGKASYFLTSEGMGTHDIVFGYDTFDDIRFAINHQTGSDFTVWSSNIIVDSQNRVFPQLVGPRTWIGWFAVFNLDIAQPTSFKTNSFYVNDSWQLNEHWSFNLGLRYDENDGANSAGATIADDSKVSPRLGLSYDAKGDGDLVVNASYGTYVAAVANSIADGTSNGGAIGLILSSYLGPSVNADRNCAAAGTCVATSDALRTLFDWYFSHGGITDPNGNISGVQGLFYTCIPGVTAIIPDTLKSPSADELTVGVTKRLGSKGMFRADVVYRDWTDFYSDRRDLTTGSVISNGIPIDRTFVGNFGNDILERTYTAINTQFRYRLTDRLTIAGNYTLSNLEGNINGENETSGPLSSSPFDYPEYSEIRWSFPKGDLRGDQRHKLRAWAVYDILDSERNSLSVSLLQSFYSGTPYGAVGAVNTVDLVGDIGYKSVADPFTYYFTARDAFHTDNLTRTDIAFNYAFRWNAFGKSMEVFIQPEVINIFNEDAVHWIDDINDDVLDATVSAAYPDFNPFTTTPVEGVHWDKVAAFGRPNNEDAFQDPREFRFSVGFRF